MGCLLRLGALLLFGIIITWLGAWEIVFAVVGILVLCAIL